MSVGRLRVRSGSHTRSRPSARAWHTAASPAVPMPGLVAEEPAEAEVLPLLYLHDLTSSETRLGCERWLRLAGGWTESLGS